MAIEYEEDPKKYVEQYKDAAEKYTPDKIKVLFVAESPPCPEKNEKPAYFYFEDGELGDLFQSIMKVLFPEDFIMFKKKLLELFKEKGCFLIDAVEYPINQLGRDKERNPRIKEECLNLKWSDKLRNTVKVNKETKIILIKKNIHQLLAGKLKNEGFNVLNTKHLSFPSRGHQQKFQDELNKLLKDNNCITAVVEPSKII